MYISTVALLGLFFVYCMFSITRGYASSKPYDHFLPGFLQGLAIPEFMLLSIGVWVAIPIVCLFLAFLWPITLLGILMFLVAKVIRSRADNFSDEGKQT